MVDFIVPAYNCSRTVAEALESILAQGPRVRKVIAVDDGSTDMTGQICNEFSRRDTRVKVIHKQRGGEASALNAGLSRADAEFIAIVEADVRLQPGWLESMLLEFEDPGVFGAGGRLITDTRDGAVARATGYEIEERLKTTERHPVHITSANAVYRASAFRNAGSFDEKLLNSCLDAEFNLRLVRKGHKLAYNKNACAAHHAKETLAGYICRQYQYARFRPRLPGLRLYKADTHLLVQTGLTGIALSSAILALWEPWFLTGVLAWAAYWACITAGMYLKRKDAAVLLLPLLGTLRAACAAAGYAAGLLLK